MILVILLLTWHIGRYYENPILFSQLVAIDQYHNHAGGRARDRDSLPSGLWIRNRGLLHELVSAGDSNPERAAALDNPLGDRYSAAGRGSSIRSAVAGEPARCRDRQLRCRQGTRADPVSEY